MLRFGRVPPKPTLAQKRGAELFAFVAEGLDGKRSLSPERTVVFPERFSFIEEPDDAVDALARLIGTCRRSAGRVVHIDQDPCGLLDYGAETVAGVVARAARDGHGVRFTGTWPASPEARDIAAATGLPSLLGVRAPWHPAFYTFPLQQGHRGKETAHKSSERERVADEFARYIDQCLAPYGIGLTHPGIGRMCALLGEVIGNAEDHCGRDEWWIGGYLRQEKEDFGDCHVVLFNLGQTIYQSMKQLPPSSLLRSQIEALAARHSKRGFFRRSFGEEELWTLYALQAGSSRHQTSPTELDADRGQGLADMITWFQELGGTSQDGAEPRMCLVSGRTYIRFDPGRYQMKEQDTAGGERRRIIAFNPHNDLAQPPDEQSVRRLHRAFPGTLISLRVYLDGRYLRTLPPSGDGHA